MKSNVCRSSVLLGLVLLFDAVGCDAQLEQPSSGPTQEQASQPLAADPSPTLASVCGNGSVEVGEACDDKNTIAGDGCGATCTIEAGYSCYDTPGHPHSLCFAGCGEGTLGEGEQCDDGNSAGTDGCSATCTVEPGFVCAGFPLSKCEADCGDGIKAASEECDDGNETHGDGCSEKCEIEAALGYGCQNTGKSVIYSRHGKSDCTDARMGTPNLSALAPLPELSTPDRYRIRYVAGAVSFSGLNNWYPGVFGVNYTGSPEPGSFALGYGFPATMSLTWGEAVPKGFSLKRDFDAVSGGVRIAFIDTDCISKANNSENVVFYRVDSLSVCQRIPVITTPPEGGTSAGNISGTATPGSTVRIHIDGSTTDACTATTAADGTWACSVTGITEVGQTIVARSTVLSATENSAPRTFTGDITPPDTTIVSRPPSLTHATSATFDFSSEAGVSYMCRLDSTLDFTPCTGPVTFTGLGGGVHHLEVSAVDAAGNRDLTPASYKWTIGLVSERPTITEPTNGSLILDKSPAYSGTAGPGLEVIVKREEGTVVCTATADATGDWSCVEPTLLADGAHTVLAVSGSAPVPPGEPARTTFTVTAPVIPLPSTGGGGGGGPVPGLDTPGRLSPYGRGCSSSGGSPWMWLVLLTVPVMRSRRMHPTPRGSTLAAGLMLLGVLAAPRAGAQSTDPSPPSQAIDVQRYKPGPGAMDILGVHGAQVGQGWHLGASLHYASNTLGFFDETQNDFTYQVVASQLTLDLMGSVSSCGRFELGVALPLTYQASERGAAPLAFAEGVTGAGLGDLRMVPKVRLLSTGGLHLGLAVPVLLPTSGGRAFRGGASVAVQPQLLGEWATSGGLRLVANLGVHVRAEERLLTLRTGNEWMYALGARVPLGERLAVQAQLAGALGWRERDAEELPLELLGAVQYHVRDGLRAHVGGGPGLTRGYGTPGFRVFAGFEWTPPGSP